MSPHKSSGVAKPKHLVFEMLILYRRPPRPSYFKIHKSLSNMTSDCNSLFKGIMICKAVKKWRDIRIRPTPVTSSVVGQRATIFQVWKHFRNRDLAVRMSNYMLATLDRFFETDKDMRLRCTFSSFPLICRQPQLYPRWDNPRRRVWRSSESPSRQWWSFVFTRIRCSSSGVRHRLQRDFGAGK